MNVAILTFFVLLLNACLCAVTADTNTDRLSSNQNTNVFFFKKSSVQSIKIAEPKVVELDFNEDKKWQQLYKTFSTASSSASWCSSLLYIQDDENFDPSRKYEARVSFAGTPPVKYEMSAIRIPHSSAKKTRLIKLKSGSHPDELNYDNDEDDDEDEILSKSKSHHQNTRVLLDTERIQFSTETLDTFEQTQRKAHLAALHLKEKVRSENVGDFITKDFEVNRVPDQKGILSAEAVVSSESTMMKTSDTFICIQAKEFGSSSEAFAKMTTKSSSSADQQVEYNIKFVVTVDKMLFGALPYSALPSVAIAGFYVVIAVFILLPRILRTI